MYSAADVERVALLRQLTEQGHAIGSVAPLTIEQLRELSSVQTNGSLQHKVAQHSRSAPLRMVVIGQAMAMRLSRPAVLNRCGTPPEVMAIFESLADAAAGASKSNLAATDLVLWQVSDLRVAVLPELAAAQAAWGSCAVAVSYRFSSAAERATFANADVHLVREPSDDAALGTWLATLAVELHQSTARVAGERKIVATTPWVVGALGLSESPAPLRRFDDAMLTEFAGLSSRIACECPGHVAELLLQISSFEAYSASCESRSPADAELHAYVHRVAGAARILFESALERIASAEGFALPAGQSAAPLKFTSNTM